MGRPRQENARSRHPLYATWSGMLSRCNNKNYDSYKNYGGRGISVCARWVDFSAFVHDVGERPSPAHSIDRIDVNGNYEPGNVRWATALEQARNKRPYVPKYVPTGITRILCRAQSAMHAWMVATETSQPSAAKMFGVSKGAIWGWLSGRIRPAHHYRLAVERLCGIPALDWLTPEEYRIAFGDSEPRVAEPRLKGCGQFANSQ